jgi:hypothetical protein
MGSVAAGVVAIRAGIRQLRQARRVGSLAEASIRNIAPGLVRLVGNVEGDNPLTSILTGQPCFYYAANAEKELGKEVGKTRTVNMHKASEMRCFYLNDGTARVLIEPANAEFDLPETLNAGLGRESGCTCHIDPLLGLPVPTEKELRFLLKWDWTQPRAMVAEAEGGEENEAKGWKKLIPKEMEVEIEGLGGFTAGEEEANRYKITETCLLAGREYSIVGTCEKNQSSEGGYVVKSGATDKTFVISSKKGDAMVASIRKKGFIMLALAVVMIVIGIVLLATRDSWAQA